MAGTQKDYIGYGTIGARPSSPAITAVTGGSAFYYATDTNTMYAWDGAAWHALSASATLSSQTNALTGDVTMTLANTWYDGPSLSLTAGTYLVLASLTLQVGTDDLTVRIWDGTTTYVSGGGPRNSGGASGQETVSLSWPITLSITTTIKVSAACNGTTGKIKAAANSNPVGNNASTLVAVKIA